MHKYLFIAVTLLIWVTACQVVEISEPSQRLTISISADPVYEDEGQLDTRAVIHGTKMYWTPGDSLGVFPDRGSQIYFLVETEGEAVSAPFDGGGWEFKANSIYRSYYPFYGDIYLNPSIIPVQFYKFNDEDLELQTQIGNDSSVHTSDYLYMFTDPKQVDDGRIYFTYHHLWTVLKPSVYLPSGHYTKLMFSLDDPLFIVKGYYDLTSEAPAIIGTEFKNEVSLNLDITLEEPETLIAYYATAPLDMRGKTLTITITEESGKEYSYNYFPSKSYIAGMTYRLPANDGFVVEGVALDQSAIELHVNETHTLIATVFPETVVDEGVNWMSSDPSVATVDENGNVTGISPGSAIITVTTENENKSASCEVTVFQANNTIYYTTSDENTVTINLGPSNPNNIIANNYVDGHGVLVFDSEIQLIDVSAFSGCTSLTSIALPESVTSIGNSAFENCTSLSSIIIPNGVTSIGFGAFRGCTSLTSIALPESVTSIGNYAFNKCTSLSSIIIPNGVTSIGRSVFNSCTGLTSIIIPESVTSIDYRAFYGCSNLTNITIPESVTSIGEDAFRNCTSIEGIFIPDSITDFGIYVFAGCTSLMSFSGPYASSDGLFLVYQGRIIATAIAAMNGSITIPNSVTSIEGRAFSGCTGITSITIPGSVTSIGSYAFENCSNLESINILDGVSSISDFAFSSCTSLSNITIPESVTSISNYAFYGCTSLTNITIPGSVTNIGHHAFYGCTSLASVIIRNGVTSIDQNVFGGCINLTHITIPESVTSIGSSAFRGCAGLTSITIPESVTRIEDHLFNGCTSLSTINIPESVTSIGNYAFSGCTSLSSIIIPNGVTSIGDVGVGFWVGNAFAGCTSLTTITIPESVTSIGARTFSGCTSLANVIIRNGVTSIDQDVFDGCINLTHITIPESVTSIGSSAFRGCAGLTSITIPESVTRIEDHLFNGCTSLSTINIPESVTSIGNSAFENCTSLSSIIIPNGVTSIGSGAFKNCSKLSLVEANAITPPSGANDMFYNTNNCPIYVPSQSVDLYKEASYWNNYENRIQAKE